MEQIVSTDQGVWVGPDPALGNVKVLTVTLDTIHARLAARAVAYSLLAAGEDALSQAILKLVGEEG